MLQPIVVGHGLSPLDLAKFIRSRVAAGKSNAEIARRMGIDQTTVAHHLALLTLPPVCASMRPPRGATMPTVEQGLGTQVMR
jgi:FixJ family two-component response regulator